MENKTLLNILSPIGGIEYKKNYIRVGDYLGRVYVITKYPQKVRVRYREQEGYIIDKDGNLYMVSLESGNYVDSFTADQLEKCW